MDLKRFKSVLAVGETVAVEFKRCGAGIEADAYETVCAFLNRFGGDVYLGVEDDGTVSGVPEKAAPDMVKNFINMVGNPDAISPTAYLAPEVFQYEGKTVIHIRVPVSADVHTYKRVVYDRAGDADIRVKGTNRIAEMYIRKHNIFTERRVFKYVTEEDLRLDLIPRLRQMAVNRIIDHPWGMLGDLEMLKSAGLYGEDKATGDKGYLLAAVMLLGKDDVIRSVVPAYRTDALLRKVNVDRYDDRLMVQTNLIESYGLLMGFAEKHLWDKFYLEDDARISLRNAIAREILANTLMHREFTSSYVAKFVIEKDRMFTENANRAASDNPITPENLEPNPKNPIVAAFFRNIGLADELGSGVRKLFRYVTRYSGKDPQLLDGDVFRTIVPLDDSYSFDAKLGENQRAKSKGKICTLNCTLSEKTIIEFVRNNPSATQDAISKAIGRSVRTVKTDMAHLREIGLLVREGSKMKGTWVVKEP
ncbi:MAG: putative DNA binding domain-containing protein [Clostridiales bacterium]|jgi:ATP-dependent DNA helicase RecG|nr:putative DNA binding domain-containing protein [Clostridiales bacterium]